MTVVLCCNVYLTLVSVGLRAPGFVSLENGFKTLNGIPAGVYAAISGSLGYKDIFRTSLNMVP